MKIIFINASPRKKGNSASIARILAHKLMDLGDVQIENIFLSDLDMGFCQGCCKCLVTGEKGCPNKNDARRELEQKLLSADGVVFLTPVYAMNMPAQMKNFMDRFAFTMHRPRFFNQYAMIIAITGIAGLKETINSVSQLAFCGFNIVEKLGIVAKNPLKNSPVIDEKMVKAIEKKAFAFYNSIKKKKPISPSLSSVIAFNFQRKCFAKMKETAPADWQYFESNGWFDEKIDYYVPSAKIGLWKKVVANLVCRN